MNSSLSTIRTAPLAIRPSDSIPSLPLVMTHGKHRDLPSRIIIWVAPIIQRSALIILLVIVVCTGAALAKEESKAPVAAHRSLDRSRLSNDSNTPMSIERNRFEIEKRRFDLESRRLHMEQVSRYITLGAIILPLVVAWLTQRAQSRSAFDLKAAELVLGASTPLAARGRATVLEQLFPGRLPKGFALLFDTDKFPGIRRHEMTIEILRQIVDHPDQRDLIINHWEQAFPGDQWISRLRNCGEHPDCGENPGHSSCSSK